jgi:glycosyltransferase involved in cell wall biosynthesis
MKLLHIAGGFAQHPLYSHLVTHLRDHGYQQTIYAPVRSAAEKSRQPQDEAGVLVYRFRRVLNPMHRVLFRTKIRTICSDMRKCIDPTQFDLVHAHTLYSDGAAALRIHNQFGIPYLVAVRNTDLNVFMPFRPDLRWLMKSVLGQASCIVFLSPAYRAEFLSHLSGELGEVTASKAVILGNGLESSWFADCIRPTRPKRESLRVLYVGDFSRNKNVEGVLHAAAILAKRLPLQLTLVGGGGSHHDRVVSAMKAGHFPFATFLGRIDDRERLREVYGDHDIFVMPSIKESFGVVYLEALSQGLPIVHSYGQGLDGYFPSNTVSEPVDPFNVASIAKGIEKLADRLDQIRPDCRTWARGFSWHSIAKRYDAIYRAIVSQQTA